MFLKNNQAPRVVTFEEDLAKVCVGKTGNVLVQEIHYGTAAKKQLGMFAGLSNQQ